MQLTPSTSKSTSFANRALRSGHALAWFILFAILAAFLGLFALGGAIACGLSEHFADMLGWNVFGMTLLVNFTPHRMRFLDGLVHTFIAAFIGAVIASLTNLIGASAAVIGVISLFGPGAYLVEHYRPAKVVHKETDGIVAWGVFGGAVFAAVFYWIGASPNWTIAIFILITFAFIWGGLSQEIDRKTQPYVPPEFRRRYRAPVQAQPRARLQAGSDDNYGFNPATGLPMVDEFRDIQNNLFMMGGAAYIGSEIGSAMHDSHSSLSDTGHAPMFDDSPMFNPANGLMMMDNLHDTAGNIFGFDSSESSLDFNPVSGLPMINDSFDVGGNVFGTDSMSHFHDTSNDLMTHDTSTDFSSSFSDSSHDFGSSDSFSSSDSFGSDSSSMFDSSSSSSFD